MREAGCRGVGDAMVGMMTAKSGHAYRPGTAISGSRDRASG